MKKIAIIPARGGSKRITNKNIKVFFGKPIIAYSIEAAFKSGLYDEVMVSTDCEIIANVAKEYGAKVPYIRSAKTSNDYASTADVLLEVLNCYKENDIQFDYATCIYACSPFVSVKLLVDSMDIIMAKKCDCVFPVLAYNHPIQRALSLLENSYVVPFDDSKSNVRTQDLNKAYHDAGMFYTIDIKNFFVNKNLRTKDTIGIEIDELKAHDIDTENDWILAEMKYKLFFK
jgi:pseudaminic acid cytidylyltransferase